MAMEARQEWRIRHRSGDGIARSNATTGRISEPWCSIILWYRIRGKRSAVGSLPLRSGRRSSCRRRSRLARYTRGPSTVANSNTRPGRRPSSTRSQTSSLGIKLCLQVLGNRSINTSTYILHGVVLIISIRRTLRLVKHSLALRKAIRPALAPTTTTLT
jgi:hypothetical protein